MMRDILGLVITGIVVWGCFSTKTSPRSFEKEVLEVSFQNSKYFQSYDIIYVYDILGDTDDLSEVVLNSKNSLFYHSFIDTFQGKLEKPVRKEIWKNLASYKSGRENLAKINDQFHLEEKSVLVIDKAESLKAIENGLPVFQIGGIDKLPQGILHIQIYKIQGFDFLELMTVTLVQEKQNYVLIDESSELIESNELFYLDWMNTTDFTDSMESYFENDFLANIRTVDSLITHECLTLMGDSCNYRLLMPKVLEPR